MHTVETLELALNYARRKGYRVRQEWLDGSVGGACEIRGQKWLFLDPSSNAAEQLGLLLEVIQADPELMGRELPRVIRRMLPSRPILPGGPEVR